VTIILPAEAQRIERQKLCESVAETIKTYREGEIEQRTAEHVDRWLSQFTPENQLEFLREFDHVIGKTFATKDDFSKYLDMLLVEPKLVGSSASTFWRNVTLLDIQKRGFSQDEMIQLLQQRSMEHFGVEASTHPDGEEYIYLDDFIFTGGRVKQDLADWVGSKAPASGSLHVIVIARHNGSYQLEEYIQGLFEASGKKFDVKVWCYKHLKIENRNRYRAQSNILWPTSISDEPEIAAFAGGLQDKYPFSPRTPNSIVAWPFSTESGRQIVEKEFLLAGIKIINRCDNVTAKMKPLGFSFWGLGFGALITSYRNCPNNCPLAMWWGNETATSGALSWFPLLPRDGYGSARNIFRRLDSLVF
jgi:hypothetical protein